MEQNQQEVKYNLKPLHHNRIKSIKYSNSLKKGKILSFFSFPWSYFFVSVAFLTVGILDYVLLGHLIGHPEHPTIGEYVGQGNAVFLGGISFFYTVGLIPLLVGFFMLIYSILSIKQVILSFDNEIYSIQERNLIFSRITEIDSQKATKITLSNQGMKFKNIWILLFIPMALRILQYGIPLFGEHLAKDDILPLMMVITALIDICAAVIILLFPNYRLSFDTPTHLFQLTFFPLEHYYKIPQKILQFYDLWLDSNTSLQKVQPESESTHIQERTKENVNSEQIDKLDKTSSKDLFRIYFGTLLIIVSLVSAFTELFWGTDLTMFGFTYGIYLSVKFFVYNFPKYKYIKYIQSDHQVNKLRFHMIQRNKISLKAIKIIQNESTENISIAQQLNSLTVIDILGLSGVFYLATKELLWGWCYIISWNWLIAFDMVISSLIWGIISYSILIMLVGIRDVAQIGEEHIEINEKISWKIFSKSRINTLNSHSQRNFYMRILGFILIFLLALITAFFS
ncbi:MAG: hypothetical protein K9W44_07500 [Candidatus Lokiarchaeota archaeon]|nr:hypothetical protein [Candidatus Harpocratesius repetitus]